MKLLQMRRVLENETGMTRRVKTVNMRERTVWKNQLRAEAMRLFEADCPQKMVSEMRLKERRKEQEETKEDESIRRKVVLMYEQVKWQLDKEKIKKEQESSTQEAGQKERGLF